MRSFTITVLRDEAEEVQARLRPMLGRIWFTERRSWFFWIRFTVTGNERDLAAAADRVQQWRDDKIMEGAV